MDDPGDTQKTECTDDEFFDGAENLGSKTIARLVPIGRQVSPVDLTSGMSELVMGRHQTCHALCRFNDKSISNKHCRIVITNADGGLKLLVEDLSANGTFVNNLKVGKNKSIPLSNGDVLSLSGPAEGGASIVAYTVELKTPSSQPKSYDDDATQPQTPDDDTAEIPPLPPAVPPPTVSSPPTTAHPPAADHSTSLSTATAAEPVAAIDPIASPSTAAPAVAGSSSSVPGPSVACASTAGPSTSASSSKDAMVSRIAEEVECPICHEVLYKAVCVLPCLHSFCAACWSDWSRGSNAMCPQCRAMVESVRADFKMRNLVDTFLASNPERQRPAEELADMDLRDKTDDKKNVSKKRARPRRRRDDSEDSDDHDDDDDYSDEDEPPQCVRCVNPGPDGYRCDANNPRHLHCTVCNVLFPHQQGPNVPPTHCGFCQQPFCYQYLRWANNNAPLMPPCSLGPSLSPLQELLATPTFAVLPADSLNGNLFEQQVLVNHCRSKGIQLSEAARNVLTKIDAGETSIPDMPRPPYAAGGLGPPTPIRGASVSCVRCCRKIYNDLLYKARELIPTQELPAEVASRQNCWYGSGCRTQRTKPDHAKRLNHICQQTRH